MERILIITDSAHDIPPDEVSGKPIVVVPMFVSYNGRELREFYDIDVKKYWKDLDTLSEIPKTTMITPIRFMDAYRQAEADGYTHVLVITISGTGSGTYNSACMAKKMLEDSKLQIEILDSRIYSMIYGRVILECADAIMNGMSFEAVCGLARDRISHSEAILWVYTLRHLKLSGRISGVASFVGEALGLRPILRCRDGVIAPIEKVRGENKLIPGAVNHLKKYAVDPKNQDMILLYADVPEEELLRAEQAIMEAAAPKSIRRYPIGVSVVTNTGPKSLAVVYYGGGF